MTIVQYRIPPHILAAIERDFSHGMGMLYRDVVARCCRRIEEYDDPLRLISEEDPVYVFDHLEHTNPYKTEEMGRRQRDLHEARVQVRLAYVLDRSVLSSRLHRLLVSDSRRISRFVYQKLQNRYRCVQSGEEDYYDADVYCGRHYDLVVSHDLDVLLFGCMAMIRSISTQMMEVITFGDLMVRGDVQTMDELVRLCILLGTDYDDRTIPHFIHVVRSSI